jgi:hypothetical protein
LLPDKLAGGGKRLVDVETRNDAMRVGYIQSFNSFSLIEASPAASEA